MNRFKDFIAAFVFTLVSIADTHVVAAERIRLQPVYLTDLQSCVDTLGEFSWACDFYEGELWSHVFGYRGGGDVGYWGITRNIQTPSYRYDLDGDGLDDMIIKVSEAFCERGQSVHNCSHFVLFGDQPATDGLRAIGFSGDGPVDLFMRDGVTEIFQENYPDSFYPIAKLRGELAGATLLTMDRK